MREDARECELDLVVMTVRREQVRERKGEKVMKRMRKRDACWNEVN